MPKKRLSVNLNKEQVKKLERIGEYLDPNDNPNRSLALREVLERMDPAQWVNDNKDLKPVFPENKRLKQVHKVLLNHADFKGKTPGEQEIFEIDQDLMELRTSQCLGKKWESGKPQEVLDKLKILGHISGSKINGDNWKILKHFSEPESINEEEIGSGKFYSWKEFFNSKGKVKNFIRELEGD